MTPEQAAAKAAEMLDRAAEQPLSTEYVHSCVAIADGWTRLYATLMTGTFMGGGH